MSRNYAEHRVKTYAILAIKRFLKNLKASDLHFTEDFEVDFKEDPAKKDTMYLHIDDPVSGLEILSIKVTHTSR